MPFNWEKRRNKELMEVKTIYKELKRREDMINQYYLKSSIMKGDAKIKDLDKYLKEKKELENVNDIMIFQEKQEGSVEEERKMPRITK